MLRYEDGFTGLAAIPRWLRSILDFESGRTGVDFHVSMLQQIMTFSAGKPAPTIAFPHKTDSPAFDNVILTNEDKTFKVTLARTCDYLADAEVPKSNKWNVVLYNGDTQFPLFYFYKGKLVINATFGEAEISELTTNQRRRKAQQPPNPGSLIFADFPAIVDEYLEYLAKYDNKEEAKFWTDFRSRDLQDKVDKINRDVNMQEAEITELQACIRKVLDKLSELRRFRYGIEAELKEPRKYLDEFDQLGNMCRHMYTGFAANNNQLVAITRPIMMKDMASQVLYRMGRYKITIAMKEASVHVSNLDGYGYGGRCHPHVNEGGDPCFGNIAASLPKLIKDGEIITALLMLHQWLCALNRADAYYAITEAPGFDKDGNLLPRGAEPDTMSSIQCGVCELFFDEKDTHICGQCDTTVCKGCKKEEYNEVFCSDSCVREYALDSGLDAKDLPPVIPPAA